MRPSAASAFATLASAAGAVSSPPRPFLLLSTHKSSAPLSVAQYAAQSTVLDTVKPYLAKCPTQQYLIVNQADLRSSEIYDANTIPNLRRHIEGSQWSDRLEVGEVHDVPIDGDVLAGVIRSSCPDAVVETRYLRCLGAGDARSAVLADNDLALSESLSTLSSTESLTLIYYGGAVDADLEAAASKHQYVAEFPDDGSHIELKRRLADPPRSAARADEEDEEDWPSPPDTTDWTWFQTHAWISPAQVVIIITLIAFSLVMVLAMMCVTGIDVPYDSFDSDYVAAAATTEKKSSR